jgi:Zn-dependent M28 family amino/carboxypeptidase
VPEGSAGIERTMVAYLTSAGKPPEDAAFEGSSDYDPFMQAGIPTGWLFTGGSDEQEMSDDQAERWGGEAGQPFDPSYHKKTDTLEHIDRTAMEINGRRRLRSRDLRAGSRRAQRSADPRRTRHVLTNS